MITYFKSVVDTSKPYYVDVSTALSRIRDGKSMDKIISIRNEEDKKERNIKKKELPSICFSGKFTERSDNACIEHSGLICIDFDGFKTKEDLYEFRNSIESDEYTYACFLSPSGDGIKVLIRIPKDASNHKKYFNALKEYYNRPEFDQTCKNISRVCYESYDPDVYINELSDTWDQMKSDYVPPKKNTVVVAIEDEDRIIKNLRTWWEKDYGMVEGSRNNNMYILACAFNEYGIGRNVAEAVLNNYDVTGEMASEIPTIIYSAYKNTALFGTKKFDDSILKTAIKNEIKKGTPIDDVKEKYKIDDVPEVSDEDFWTKSSKGKIDLVPHLFKKYLEDNGFYKYFPPGSNNYVFVRIIDNTISDVNEEMIKDFVLDYLLSKGDMSVYNFFAINTKFFQDTFLNYVSKLNAKFIGDTQDEAYLYFRNCAVKVTSTSIKTIDYRDLDGHIWEKQKIERDFVVRNDEDAEFSKFIDNISGNNPDRRKSVESTIGYMMHSYKPASYCPAVILNDEVISDNPEGGTGKGIFVKSLSHMKKMVIIDGKGFSFQKSFAYQRVQVDTQLLVFDDVARNFDFERLFSVITEGITLEKKNKDEIHIPFENSPKIIITTNYAIRGAGNSFERRKWDLEFKQHYTKNFTPESEFGHMLFSDWTDVEWSRFDNYMISNLQFYLNKGLVRSEFKNLKTRKFIAETSADFWEWSTSQDNIFVRVGHLHTGLEMYKSFTDDYPDYGNYGRYKISHIKFYRWLDALGEFLYNCKPRVSRSAIGKTVEFFEKNDPNDELKF